MKLSVQYTEDSYWIIRMFQFIPADGKLNFIKKDVILLFGIGNLRPDIPRKFVRRAKIFKLLKNTGSFTTFVQCQQLLEERDIATALRSQHGYGDEKATQQLTDILDGNATLDLRTDSYDTDSSNVCFATPESQCQLWEDLLNYYLEPSKYSSFSTNSLNTVTILENSGYISTILRKMK